MLENSHAYSGFAVPDIKQAEEFYSETLGLDTEVLAEDDLLQLNLAGDRPTLVYLKPDFEPATYTILNFPVEDVDGTVDKLVASGITFERYEGTDQDEKGISRSDTGPTIAWFKDPAGNILSVHEAQ